jgi:hypothetical protein
METRHDDHDGSDIFWPGYVDATTNLILNLLFLLTILIVAVFMFALELGRSSPKQSEAEKPPIVAAKQDAEAVAKATAAPGQDNLAAGLGLSGPSPVKSGQAPVGAAKQDAAAGIDPVQENIVLKREIERLRRMLAQKASPKVQSGGPVKSVEATVNPPKPQSGLDKTLASALEIEVHFTDEAIALTPAEHDRLRESLRPIVANGDTTIFVEVPAGFSEAKRMGFYRAMAVRNLLIEMELPTESIDVAVVEGKNNANASLVKVRSR